MQNRINKSTIRFNIAFSLAGSNREFPPGDYSILEHEELIEGISWLAYRRTAVFIEVPLTGNAGSQTQMLEIDHDSLNAVLARDLRNQTEVRLGDKSFVERPA